MKQPQNDVLIVTRNFPPLTGGMERLMHYIVRSLDSVATVTLVGPKGARKFTDASRVIECPSRPILYLCSALWKGIFYLFRNRPTMVFGGSGLVAPLVVLFGKISGARSVVHVHGLDLVANNPIYRWCFLPCIRRSDLLIANSRNTKRLALEAGCSASRVEVVNPGTELPDSVNAHAARKRLDLDHDRIVLFAGRLIERKGLARFLAEGWRQVYRTIPSAHLVVAGDQPDVGFASNQTEASRVGALLSDSELNASVSFLGRVSDADLWDCYAASDVLIFPLVHVSGDVEGFGMVAVEAAAAGTPTVAFAVGGVADAVKEGVSGYLIEEGDYAKFAQAVVEVLETGEPDPQSCRDFARQFSWSNHHDRLMAALSTTEERKSSLIA